MKRNNFFIGIFYILILLTAYGRLSQTFFLQDEWAIFGNYLYWDKAGLDWFNRLFIYEQSTHIIPLANIFSYIQFKLFNLNFAPYAWVSIFLHLLNGILVWRLALLLSKNKTPALLAGIFFLANSIPQQAVTWIATTSGTVTTTTFVLLSLIMTVKKRLLIAVMLFAISLLFKESSVFIFLFLPVFYLLVHGKKVKQILTPLVILGFLFISMRVFFLFTLLSSSASAEELAQPNLTTFLFRIFTVPLKGLSQSIIPQGLLLTAADAIVKLGYPQFVENSVAEPHIVQTAGADTVSYISAILILVTAGAMIYFLYNKNDKPNMKIILISLSLIVTSVMPFIIIPGRAGYFSLIDGRHFYITSIGTSLLLAAFATFVLHSIKVKRWQFATSLIIVLYILFNIKAIRTSINSQIAIGNTRQSILNQIADDYPKLPERVIFYTESDKAFYGLPPEETILPFQSGLGNTLVVWYDIGGEELPACFFDKKYLYTLLSQDYKECQNHGFGYYRSPASIIEIALKHNLKKESIIAYSYNSIENTLTNISDEVQKKITPGID
jgi:hypothetical protein